MQLSTTTDVCAARSFGSANKKKRASTSIEWIRECAVPQFELKVEKSCAPSSETGTLESALAESRRLLELLPNWDDEGAESIHESTWIRAANFLRKTANRVANAGSIVFPVPTLKPCPDGSIDLHWKNDLFELLLNIPPISRSAGDFYGESRDGLTVKGSFQPEIHNQGIVCWLLSNG